jgi:hypothetical protein
MSSVWVPLAAVSFQTVWMMLLDPAGAPLTGLGAGLGEPREIQNVGRRRVGDIAINQEPPHRQKLRITIDPQMPTSIAVIVVNGDCGA